MSHHSSTSNVCCGLVPGPDMIKLQLVEAGLVECLLQVVAQTVDGDREEDIAQLKTSSDLMVLLLLGGKCSNCNVDIKSVTNHVGKREFVMSCHYTHMDCVRHFSAK